MHRLAGAVALSMLVAGTVHAGPEKVAFPEGYQSHFVRYTTVDKSKRKTVRFMYVNPESLANARANQPAPLGTVLIMEDHKAKLDSDGNPVKDARGRFVATSEITNIFVQEKRAGWGAEYTAEKRNGKWEYAWFEPSTEPRTGPNISFDGCFARHKKLAESDDYAFTFPAFLAAIKK